MPESVKDEVVVAHVARLLLVCCLDYGRMKHSCGIPPAVLLVPLTRRCRAAWVMFVSSPLLFPLCAWLVVMDCTRQG